MIPLRLHLRNFLSYGDNPEPIDLDGVHVACLCGSNGNGKSALLDAMTWSLWGQARSNSADDLVRLGQTHMQVELEFKLDGQDFRVIRKRSRGRSSQSDLQFQTRQEDGAWRALTGQGVRDTQARINQVLRMDYDTFINSAFILQGRADEFARRRPDERKKILGEILSLSLYDQLCEASRARRREAEVRVRSLEAEITHMEAELAREPELAAQVERLTLQHAEAQVAAEKRRAELQTVLTEKARLDEVRKKRDDLVRRLASAEAELNVQRGILATSQRKVAAAQALLERAGEIRERAGEYFRLRQEQEEMTARLSQLRTLEGERNLQQRRLQEAEYRLRTALQLAQQQVRELNAVAEHLPKMAADLADLERQALALDRLQEGQGTLNARLQELAGLRAAAAAEQRRCFDELERADGRFQLLKGAQASCPTCEGALPDAKRLDLGRKLREEKVALKEAQGRAIQAEADARREETETRRKLQELEAKLKTGQHMRDRLAQAKQEYQRYQEAEQSLAGDLEQVRVLEAQLAEDRFEPEARQALAELETRMRGLTYDDQQRRQVAARLTALAGAERDLQALEHAEAELPEALRQAETLAESIRTREEAMAEDRAVRAEADGELTRQAAVEAEVRRLQAELQQAEVTEVALTRQLGAAVEARERCAALVPQLADRRQVRDAAARDEAGYEELGKAFGRNGIQALIIENALPEIEAEANALLGRMSEGQLAVRLKTQRELRSGAQAETLEIEISDGMGARRYELYSGGEAFRVNFALRIALSKLLARRAGARLETLVIDEGFGSQDQDGRQRLIEAIRTVQDEFAKILVITHLDEMKDAFPTRIEVTKGPSGSQVAVY